MTTKTLKERVQKKKRPYRGLMASGRVWARINPALRPWIRRWLDTNPGKFNELLNLALADFFDAQAARDKLDAEVHVEKLLGGVGKDG